MKTTTMALFACRVFLVMSTVLLLLSAHRTTAQAATVLPRFQYATKFICETNIGGTSAQTTTVLPGAYRTVVNIHNPNNETVSLRKKIAVPSQVSEFIPGKLAADQVEQVDCSRILKDFGIHFIHGAEGFLVIESTHSLDVVAVYTAGKRVSDNAVESVAVERVHEREITPGSH